MRSGRPAWRGLSGTRLLPGPDLETLRRYVPRELLPEPGRVVLLSGALLPWRRLPMEMAEAQPVVERQRAGRHHSYEAVSRAGSALQHLVQQHGGRGRDVERLDP